MGWKIIGNVFLKIAAVPYLFVFQFISMNFDLNCEKTLVITIVRICHYSSRTAGRFTNFHLTRSSMIRQTFLKLCLCWREPNVSDQISGFKGEERQTLKLTVSLVRAITRPLLLSYIFYCTFGVLNSFFRLLLTARNTDGCAARDACSPHGS
jgi:hypothetical protein